MKRNQTAEQARAGKWFYLGCAYEMLLTIVAALISWATGLRLLADFHWSWRDAGYGIAAMLPLLGLFFGMVRSHWAPLVEIREFLEASVGPIFRRWSVLQLAIISAVAGASEEILFRAVIQGGLSGTVGAVPALVLASAGFGLAHRVTTAYAVIAGCVGAYLGLVWLWSGNLLTPIMAHALYDFIALTLFFRAGLAASSRSSAAS
jgi:membrane protease YdiL (CAAX protease family)